MSRASSQTARSVDTRLGSVYKYARGGSAEFEWDPGKAASNYGKHGVRFAEAATVFEDEGVLTMFDEAADEERFVALGIGSMGRTLVVVYTARGDRIRVISARKATGRERSQYERRKQ